MKSINNLYILTIFSIFSYTSHIKAQDSIRFIMPELKVVDDFFLVDLNSYMFGYCPEWGDTNKADNIFQITINEKKTCVYEISVKKANSLKYVQFSSGFFKIGDRYCFVKGVFPDCPNKLFDEKTKIQNFYYIGREERRFDGTIELDCDGDGCEIILEYCFKKLYFKEKVW